MSGADLSLRDDLLLLRDVAADLLVPTMAIARLAEAAGLEPGVPDLVQERLQEIADEAAFARGLCLGLLEEQRQHHLVRFDQLVEAVAVAAKHAYGGRFSVRTEPALVQGSPTALHRAIACLTDNACEAATSGGRVEVRAGRDDSFAFVEVDSSGPRLDAAQRRRQQLALTTVRRVVASHAGYVTATSSSLGGACVRVLLPPAERLLDGQGCVSRQGERR
ncbi:MAG: hypothetical protein J2P57_06855 [Acidimicrobiaceae bacterium]|nr:hypothetical protein [Acidimicrobiaceae bacterium]